MQPQDGEIVLQSPGVSGKTEFKLTPEIIERMRKYRKSVKELQRLTAYAKEMAGIALKKKEERREKNRAAKKARKVMRKNRRNFHG
jgi:uncharacterized protein YjiS (DUF1127 family)